MPGVRILIPVALACGLLGVAVGWRWLHPPPPRQAKSQAGAPARPVPGSGATPVEIVSEDIGTRTVRHVLGTTTIPRHPRRVAILGWNDEVVALGVKPVAINGGEGWRDLSIHLRAQLAGAVRIDDSGGGPDLEALAAARPELIVAAALWQNGYQALSRVAPTVVLQPAHLEWQQRFRDLALVLDRQEEAEDRLAELAQRIAATRDAIRARIGDESVAVVRVFAREFRLYGRGYSGPLLYQDLALAVPGLVRADAWDKDVIRLSIEGMCRLDADHILLMAEEHIPVSLQVRDRLAAHPLWERLPAVRAGHVHIVPDMVMRGGIISRGLMLEVLRRALAP